MGRKFIVEEVEEKKSDPVGCCVGGIIMLIALIFVVGYLKSCMGCSG